MKKQSLDKCVFFIFRTLCDFNQHCDWRKALLPSSPFSMTSKVVQESSAVKVTFLILSALSASSEDRMLGETCRKHNKQIHPDTDKEHKP